MILHGPWTVRLLDFDKFKSVDSKSCCITAVLIRIKFNLWQKSELPSVYQVGFFRMNSFRTSHPFQHMDPLLPDPSRMSKLSQYNVPLAPLKQLENWGGISHFVFSIHAGEVMGTSKFAMRQESPVPVWLCSLVGSTMLFDRVREVVESFQCHWC